MLLAHGGRSCCPLFVFRTNCQELRPYNPLVHPAHLQVAAVALHIVPMAPILTHRVPIHRAQTARDPAAPRRAPVLTLRALTRRVRLVRRAAARARPLVTARGRRGPTAHLAHVQLALVVHVQQALEGPRVRAAAMLARVLADLRVPVAATLVHGPAVFRARGPVRRDRHRVAWSLRPRQPARCTMNLSRL